ncbi:MAG: RNA polymerase sigma factor [Candidatus Tyrphobacter sp.]
MLGDPAGAEDVTQSVFLKIWSSPGVFHSGSFSAWIARVTRNRALDMRRCHARTIPCSIGSRSGNTAALPWTLDPEHDDAHLCQGHDASEACCCRPARSLAHAAVRDFLWPNGDQNVGHARLRSPYKSENPRQIKGFHSCKWLRMLDSNQRPAD